MYVRLLSDQDEIQPRLLLPLTKNVASSMAVSYVFNVCLNLEVFCAAWL